MSKHTPGPWKTDIRSGIAVVYFGPENTEACIDGIPNNRRLAEFHGEYHEDIGCWKLGPRDEGNACLIAAAPDLLTAVSRFVEYYKSCPGRLGNGQARKSLDEFEAAITKAEGRRA